MSKKKRTEKPRSQKARKLTSKELTLLLKEEDKRGQQVTEE